MFFGDRSDNLCPSAPFVDKLYSWQLYGKKHPRCERPAYGVFDILTFTAFVPFFVAAPITDVAIFSARRFCCGENVLFLTNSEIAMPLFKWLKKKEKSVALYDRAIDAAFIQKRGVSFVISYGYRHIIPKSAIELMGAKMINLHISFLPYNRGAHPNIWSFLEGTSAGVTIHRIDDRIDNGDILLRERIEFDYKTETLKSAYLKSHNQIQRLLKDNWKRIKRLEITPEKQPGGGTYHSASALRPFENAIDYNDTIETFLRKVKAVRAE